MGNAYKRLLSDRDLLRVQLQAGNGSCWESTFSAARVNDGNRFQARSD